MVKGLRLAAELGYARGSFVRVTDPANSSSQAWEYVVSNDEHATLVSSRPPPPSWIQPGARIRIEVWPSGEHERHLEAGGYSSPSLRPKPGRVSVDRTLTSSEVADYRRELLRLLDRIESARPAAASEGVAARIGRLVRENRVPRDIAAFMRTVTEVRNRTEYDGKLLTVAESAAVRAAWQVVTEWALNQRLGESTPKRS
jgi:hypothetical protein